MWNIPGSSRNEPVGGLAAHEGPDPPFSHSLVGVAVALSLLASLEASGIDRGGVSRIYCSAFSRL